MEKESHEAIAAIEEASSGSARFLLADARNRIIDSQRGGSIRRESWEQLGRVWAYMEVGLLYGFFEPLRFPGGSCGCMRLIMGRCRRLAVLLEPRATKS